MHNRFYRFHNSVWFPIFYLFKAAKTPMWAIPRAPPPPNEIPNFAFIFFLEKINSNPEQSRRHFLSLREI